MQWEYLAMFVKQSMFLLCYCLLPSLTQKHTITEHPKLEGSHKDPPMLRMVFNCSLSSSSLHLCLLPWGAAPCSLPSEAEPFPHIHLILPWCSPLSCCGWDKRRSPADGSELPGASRWVLRKRAGLRVASTELYWDNGRCPADSPNPLPPPGEPWGRGKDLEWCSLSCCADSPELPEALAVSREATEESCAIGEAEDLALDGKKSWSSAWMSFPVPPLGLFFKSGQ